VTKKSKNQSSELTIYVFATHLDPGEGLKRAQDLVTHVGKCGIARVTCTLINRLSNVYADLEKVAKYGVVSSPTVVCLRGTKVVARFTEIPAVNVILEIIGMCHSG
jgi:hypothetical protein